VGGGAEPLSAEPLKAIGDLGKPPAAGGKHVWGEAPSTGQFLQFFNKNNAFLCFRLCYYISAIEAIFKQ